MKPTKSISSLEEKLNGEIILPTDDNYRKVHKVKPNTTRVTFSI